MIDIKENTTRFLGLSVQDGGPENDLIKQALGSSIKLLTIHEFMETIGFEKDPVMTDYFWQVMVKKHGSQIYNYVVYFDFQPPLIINTMVLY